MKESINNTVYFIGAGPGHPDLLTVKAAKILAQAEVVVVDRLVSPAILLQYANSDAAIISVGKQGHSGASAKQEEINDLLVSLAKKHRCIVRLKGGDTAFFSNILDELAALRQNRISYEIVPGITAASGASAYTGVPLTARGYATGVIFLSCCSYANIADEEWRSFAEMKNTLVWYMASKEWPMIARKLIFSGADLKMPLLIVEQASTSNQYVHQFFLQDFISGRPESEFISPSIIIVGNVAALFEQFSWYSSPSARSEYFKTLMPVLSEVGNDGVVMEKYGG